MSSIASAGPKTAKLPVFSLMIREFDAESGSHQTASSATQSSRSEILRAVCRKSPPVAPNLHLSRHQRRVSSSHIVRISTFYLCFEFRWCREKTDTPDASRGVLLFRSTLALGDVANCL